MKFLLSLVALFVSFNISASDIHSNDKRGIWITPKSIPQNQLALKNGDDFTFEGDICVIKWEDDDHDQKCQKIPNHKLKFKAYFPDSLHDVSDKLVITQSKDKKSWKYFLKTDKLKSTDLNQLTLTVGAGDKKSNELLSVKAKLEKRIQILKEFKNKYAGKKSYKENLDYINKLVTYFEGLIARIDLALQRNPEILAQIRLPLQVENSTPAPFYYSSNLSGYKLTLTAPVGIPLEGEKAELQASLTNLSGKSFYFPDIEDDKKDDNKGEKDEKENKSKDKKGLLLNIALDGKSLIKSAPFNLGFGETKTISTLIDKLNASAINKIETSFGVFESQQEKILGALNFVLSVMEDNFPPAFSNLRPLANSYHKTIPEFEATFSDNLGRIDAKSIKVTSNGVDITNVFAITAAGSESVYNLSGSVPDIAEGNYTLTFSGADLAGNAVSTVLNGIHYDKTAPVISLAIQDKSITNDSSFIINFNVSDISPTTTVIIQNGKEVSRLTTGIIDFNSSLVMGNNLFEIQSTDAAGNVSTKKSFTVVRNTNPVADFKCISDKPFQATCKSTSTDIDATAGADSFTEYTWVVQSQTFTSSNGTSLDHNFDGGGNFEVTLTVKDSFGGVGTVTKNIVVKDNVPPIAKFSCSNTGIQSIHCESASTDSDGSISTSFWTLDDGKSFSGASLDHFFNEGGNHKITLHVIDNLGGTSESFNNYELISNQSPTVELYASNLSGVFPLAINFEARNALDVDGSIASIQWFFSDGTKASGASVSHTFKSIGNFTATLTVTDNLGSVTTKSVNITTLEALKAAPNFFFKYFEDGSTKVELISSIIKTQFDIDHAFYTIDGGETFPLSEFYPGTRTVIDFKTYGLHTVSLTVVDIRGQTVTNSYQVNLLKNPSTLKPIADFKVSQSSVRTAFFNFNLSFNPDTRFGIKNYHIDFGDNTSADISNDTFATHTYLNSGTYKAVLTVTSTQGNGTIFNSVTKEITVTDQDVSALKPVAAFNYEVNTWAQNVSFVNEKSGTPNGEIISYQWDFGDGTKGTGERIAHFYDPGSYLVTLLVTDSAGLQNSQTQHVTITQAGSNLVANIDCGIATTQLQSCNVYALDKFNEINSINVSWGDGTSNVLSTPLVPEQGLYKINKKFFTSGIQTITLFVSTKRGETKTVTVTKEVILSPPVAKLNCTTDNLKIVCDIGGSYDPSRAGLDSVTFDYGNGVSETNTIGFVNYSYPLAGPYTISATIKSKSGLSSTASTQVAVKNGVPVPSINCFVNNMLVSCNAFGSFDSEMRTLSYEFDYGDGFKELNATGLSSHAYTQPGLYNVTVKVTDEFGSFGTSSAQVQPLLPPNQHPTLSLSCYSDAPYIEKCYAYAQDPDGTIVSYRYDWDDNKYDVYGAAGEVSHIFSNGGIHKVVLTVTDNDGGVRSIDYSLDVLVNQPPIASIYCYNTGAQAIHCDSRSYERDTNDAITEYKWNLGNGIIVFTMIPSIDYTYAASGTYTIDLQIKDSFGATASTFQSITTIDNRAPIASIDCLNSGLQTISCHTFSYDSDGSISKIRWNLDDGFIFNGNSFTHTFASGEVHTAKITVTDNLGGVTTETLELHVLVNKLPSFDLVVDNIRGNLPFTTHFKASNAIDIDGTIASYKWDFADGTTSDQAEIDHTFTSAGVYNVKLQVTDNDNGMTEKSVTIRTSAPSNLLINTDKDNGVANLNVHFDASESTDPDGIIEKFEWFYQGKKFAEGAQADYEFDLAGDQFIELVSTNNFGIQTKLIKTISAATPPIYLEGVVLDSAFVNREYKAVFNLKLEPGIALENISFDLEDAPVGASFDSETKKLTWVPTINDVGDVQFYLNATDGVLNYRRIFKLKVYELEQLASFSSSINGGSVTINAPDSPLDKTQIILPSNEVPYTVNFFQAKYGEKIIFNSEPSVFLTKPISIILPSEFNIVQRIQGLSNAHSGGSSYSTPSEINLISNSVTTCSNYLDQFLLDPVNEFSKGDFKPPVKIGKNNFFIGYEISNKRPTAIKNFLEVFNQVSSYVSDADIYLGDTYSLSLLGDHPAGHPMLDEKTIFFNLDNPKFSFSDAIVKHIILHENFHLLQSRVKGCTPLYTYYPPAYSNLSESSADYFSLLLLPPDEQMKVIQKDLYVDYLPNDEHGSIPYKIADSFLSKGLFYNDENFSYRNRVVWDYFNNIDPLVFFKKFGFELQASLIQTNENVLKVLKSTFTEKGQDFSQSMLRLTDGIYNYSGPNGRLVSFLKDKTIFTGWDSPEAKAQNEIRFENNPEVAFTLDTVEIAVTLPAFSGVSKNLLVQKLLLELQPGTNGNVMRLELVDQSDSDVKLSARSVDENGTVSGTIRSFVSAGGSTTGTLKNFNARERIIFNVVNTGSVDKKIKVKISSMLPNLDLEVSGAVKNATDPSIFEYSGGTNFSNNATVKAIDKNDSDNSTIFGFTYYAFDKRIFDSCIGDCSYFSLKTVSNVQSISDFSIPFSLYTYNLTVSATNKFGTVSKSFSVKTRTDSKPSLRLAYLSECNWENIRKALIRITDSDSEYVTAKFGGASRVPMGGGNAGGVDHEISFNMTRDFYAASANSVNYSIITVPGCVN